MCNPGWRRSSVSIAGNASSGPSCASIRRCAGASRTAAGPTKSFCTSCSKPKSPAAGRALRAGCCAKRACPTSKRSNQVDWQALKGVAKPKILELASCQFITNAESVIVAGPIGTGKTMLAIALGVEATRCRFRVLFVRAADLVQSLLEARDERTLTRLQQRYEKVALLVVDELGFVPFERTGGELLFTNKLLESLERRLI